MGEDICLSDMKRSGAEIPWKQRKRECIKIADSLKRIGDIDHANKMRYCSHELNYDKDLETLNKKLTKRNLRFCKHMLCPICQSRKSILSFKRLINIINRIEKEDGKEAALILITLTVKNVKGEVFGRTVDQILQGWKKIERTVKFSQIKGYYRSLEVTIPNPNEYHPHLHVLCMVDDEYFKSDNQNYITTKDLVQLWKKSMDVDYTPVCYMQRIKNVKGILEVSKYMVKGTDIIKNHTPEEIDQIVYNLTRGLKRRRLLSYGGRFKKVDQQLKEEMKKIGIETDQEEDYADLYHLTGNHYKMGDYIDEEIYYWDWKKGDYIRKT